jgi:hypothetical protein
MPDCDYCGASFDDESAYLSHLDAEHADELGPIERRRVDAIRSDDGGLDAAPIALGVVLVAAAAIVGYVVFVAGGAGGDGNVVNGFEVAQTPTGQPYQGTHLHGTIRMSVLGESVDFSQEQYQITSTGNDNFHFEGDGRWHVHAPGVTLEYAMATLDIGVSDDSVTFEGTTYTDGENASVAVRVNGNDVDPETYVLADGDEVSITVESA